jgi:hypothetical protein
MNDFVLIKSQHFYVEESQFEAEGLKLLSFDANITFPASFWSDVGHLFVLDMQQHPFLLKECQFNSKDDVFEQLDASAEYVLELFFSLWLLKDNSCNFISSVGYWSLSDYSLQMFSTGVYTTAKGDFADVAFGIDEISQAYKLYNKIVSLRSVKITTELKRASGALQARPGYAIGVDQYVSYNEYNRIERAIGFIKQARESTSIGAKISYYVLVLECLFATNGTSELTHKVGERCANYIGSDTKNKLVIFKKIKELYDIRSKYVHGQPLGKQFNEGKDPSPLSVEADELVRKVFVKVITEDGEKFLWKNDPFEDWVNSMIFK